MTREQHEKTAKAFLDALGRADTDTMSKLSTDDMTWWIMPGNKFSGTHAKRDYLENIPHLLDNATVPSSWNMTSLPARLTGLLLSPGATCR